MVRVYIENSRAYYISDDGIVYRNIGSDKFAVVRGWINFTKRQKHPYNRVRIYYKDGTIKQKYNHILVAIAFWGGDKTSEGKLVRHGENGWKDNSRLNVCWGTPYENQNEDRKRDGNYYNRGSRREEPVKDLNDDPLPF